jgi:hypothetical protein
MTSLAHAAHRKYLINETLCQGTSRDSIGLTSVYAMDMVLTNNSSIDEGQIMILFLGLKRLEYVVSGLSTKRWNAGEPGGAGRYTG